MELLFTVAPRLRAALLAAAAVSVGCTTAFAAEPGATDTEIQLGATNSLTGPLASGCGPVTAGINSWFKKVDDEGGVNGRKIVYNVLDDAYSPERAIANIRRLVDRDKVFAIVGGCGTPTSAAILPFFAQRTEVPFLFPYTFMSVLINPVKPNVFALPPDYASELSALVPFEVDRKKDAIKTAAIASMNIPGVQEWRAVVADYLKKKDIKIVYDDIFDITAPEKGNLVAELKSKNPDLLVLADSVTGAARAFIEMDRQGWKPKTVVSPSSIANKTFIKGAGKLANDILVTGAITLPTTDPKAAECNATLAKYSPDTTTTAQSLYGCMAAKVFVAVLSKVQGPVTREKFVAALKEMKDFDTGIGPLISFDAGQHRGINSIMPLTIANENLVSVGDPLPIPQH